MPLIPTYVVFTDLIAIRIRPWYLSVCPEYLRIFSRNGSTALYTDNFALLWSNLQEFRPLYFMHFAS